MKFTRRSEILQPHTVRSFNELALTLFRYQATANPVYREFLNLLNCPVDEIQDVESIPYLPIELFKTRRVLCEGLDPEHEFTSSGTTGSQTSTHLVPDLHWYEQSFLAGFEHVYGAVEGKAILALLPAYLERKGSSLVYMADHLIKRSGIEQSGFFLDDLEALSTTLKQLRQAEIPTILLGVSFALLQMAESYPMSFPDLTVMETGGMKGRRKELVRSELHQLLKAGFVVSQVQSEYGMTELMSQAYAKEEGRFECPPWMRVSIREHNDPRSSAKLGKTGGINIIDLANVDSCAFIATSDLGRLDEQGRFEVLGRFDHSDARGCNLLISS